MFLKIFEILGREGRIDVSSFPLMYIQVPSVEQNRFYLTKGYVVSAWSILFLTSGSYLRKMALSETPSYVHISRWSLVDQSLICDWEQYGHVDHIHCVAPEPRRTDELFGIEASAGEGRFWPRMGLGSVAMDEEPLDKWCSLPSAAFSHVDPFLLNTRNLRPKQLNQLVLCPCLVFSVMTGE